MTNTEIIVTGSTVAETVPQISGAALADDPGWVTAGLPRTYNTDSGQKMTAQIALTFSSVWQATSLISSAVAGLPLEVYRRDRTNDDRERVRLHPGWELLNLSPTGSPDISANAFRECLQAHALIRGNGYAEIIRNGSGRPVAMTILPPDMTWPDDSDGELTYWTAPSFREEARQIAARNIFHVKGLSADGVQGYSVVTMARNSWGLGLAQEKHGARHFRNGARPNIALRSQAHLTEDQATSLRQRFEERHRGLDAETSTAVLSGGLEIVPFSISNEDSQWLQAREFSRSEVASWFNLPPHFLGSSTGTAGYASLVEENRRYLQQTLLPWLRKWQAECDLKLLTPNERSEKLWYFEHNLQSLLEADTAAVVDQVTKLIQSEVITTNEARAKLNMNRRDDGLGDLFRNPAINPAVTEAEADEVAAIESAEPVAVDASAFQNLLADRLQNLQAAEFKRVISAAKRRNVQFRKWAVEHYAELLPRIEAAVVPIAEVWAAVGAKLNPAAVAVSYQSTHRDAVLNAAEKQTRNTLAEGLGAVYHNYLEQWPHDVAAIAWEESKQ